MDPQDTHSASDPVRKNRRISVVLCAHNPRLPTLQRTLSALQSQTLPTGQWELLIVDNASNPPLTDQVDLDWHPHARVVREETLGLTSARLRGVAEADGGVLIFVDDDNLLQSDYLSVAWEVAEQRPTVGVWGGRVELEFDAPPPEWTRRYWTFLVERLVERDEVTSDPRLVEPLPVGAGLCVRHEAACFYARRVAEDPLRADLDRRGAALCSGGDTDLALTVCEGGWERGVFKALRLRHLIPQTRLTEDYLARLAGGIRFSTKLLEFIHQPHKPPTPTNWWWWTRYAFRSLTRFGRKRLFFKSCKQAERMAREVYEQAVKDRALKPGVPMKSPPGGKRSADDLELPRRMS